jgi:hypothetical protein
MKSRTDVPLFNLKKCHQIWTENFNRMKIKNLKVRLKAQARSFQAQLFRFPAGSGSMPSLTSLSLWNTAYDV